MSSTLAIAERRALGTTARVVVDAPLLAEAGALLADELAIIDHACSRFRADSDLSRVNEDAGRPVVVSAVLLEAIEVALRAARLTTGLVDPTVGTALCLLGYDRDFASIASDGRALRARRVPGWRHITMDRVRSTVRVPAGVRLDLGATAKALAADRAADRVASTLGCAALVSLGGDIATAGPPPRTGWPVRVTDDHAADPDAPGETVSLTSGGLATSSVTVRQWARGAETLHHLIDPTTGLPADGPFRTISVAAATCVDANIASTAALVLGRDAPSWLAQRQLPARLTRRDGRVLHVGGWCGDGRIA